MWILHSLLPLLGVNDLLLLCNKKFILVTPKGTLDHCAGNNILANLQCLSFPLRVPLYYSENEIESDIFLRSFTTHSSL